MPIINSSPFTPSQRRNRNLFRAILATSIMGALAFGTNATVIASENLDRSVETVNVTLGTDGSIDGIHSSFTNFSLTPNSTEVETIDGVHSPLEDAKRLPVRITASYTTTERSGSNLSDLKNADGRIRIDLHVHNLTVQPETITLDTNGRSLKRSELVGLPMTVVASTILPGNPVQVVAQDLPSLGAATNGVVSQNAAGDTVVQWATVLAPPTTHASARFSLVVDAQDFSVPSFDISVQPGLISDTSGESLIENALNPEKTPEARLTADTITVLSRARDVFSESGKTLNDVRELLQTSAKNIGDRTIQDLRSSNSRIQSSARGLSTTLNTLEQAISHELDNSGSTLAQGMNITTAKVHHLLGRTDQSAPQLGTEVDPTTCEVTITGKDNYSPQGVYGVLLTLDATMDAYAKASSSCHANVVASLLAQLGPETADAQLCQANPETMTCKLYTATRSVEKSLEDLESASKSSVEKLRSLPATDLSNQLANTKASVQKLKALHQVIAHTPALSELTKPRTEIIGVETDLGTIATELEATSADFTALLDEIEKNHSQLRDEIQSGREEIERARMFVEDTVSLLCAQSDDPENDGTQEILEMLTPTGCEGDIFQYESTEDALYSRLNKADEHLTAIQNKIPTNLNANRNLLKPTLDKIQDAQKKLTKSISSLTLSADSAMSARTGELEQLQLLIEQAETETTALTPFVDKLNQELDKVISEVETDTTSRIDSAQSTVNAHMVNAASQAHRTSVALGKDSSKRINAILDKVSGTSNLILDEGKSALDEAAQETEKGHTALSAEVKAKLTASAKNVSQRVNVAVKDSDAASALLSQDIARVLADIGENRDNGTGLLGTMATSTAQLSLADVQMARSATNTATFSNTQRSSYNEGLLHAAQLRQSLARLEKPVTFTSAGMATNTVGSVYNFHISGK